MKSLVLLVTAFAGLVQCLPPPHPDVLAVRREEELLPPLLRSPALRNPHLLQVLPLTSLLHKGEKLVYAREANEIPRMEIYKVLTHAGLIPRKLFPSSVEEEDLPRQNPSDNQISFILPEEEEPGWDEQEGFKDPSYFSSQELLQYL